MSEETKSVATPPSSDASALSPAAPTEASSSSSSSSAISPASTTKARRTAKEWGDEQKVDEWLMRAASMFHHQTQRLAGAGRDGMPIPEFLTTELTESEFAAALARVR